MFKRAAALSNVPLQDGLQVELRGRLAVYEARGELQMVVESMQRLGAGQLYEEFLRLRARLTAEGLFDPARKRPLPPFVRTVGVVTSHGRRRAARRRGHAGAARAARAGDRLSEPGAGRRRARRAGGRAGAGGAAQRGRRGASCAAAAARWRTCGRSTTSASCARSTACRARWSAASATRPTSRWSTSWPTCAPPRPPPRPRPWPSSARSCWRR